MPTLAALLRIALLSLLAFGGLTAAAGAAKPPESALDMAREEAGNPAPPRSGFALPAAGRFEVQPAETVAARTGQKLRFSVILSRPVAAGRLRLQLPKVWTETANSGLRYAQPARLAGGAARGSAVSRDGRTVELSLRDAAAGDAAAIEVVDVGIPAGDYRLPWSWTDATGAKVAGGTAIVRLYAPSREGEEDTNPWTKLEAPSMVESNATEEGDECEFVDCQATQGGNEEQSETFIGVSPYDSDRILVQSNNTDDGTEGAFLSSDGGKTYKRLKFPNDFDAPGEVEPEVGDYCCDPMSAEDNLGNIWFGGLTSAVDENAPSRIAVNRIAAGTDEFQPLSVGLPVLLEGEETDPGQQDKNLMTIDNSPTSPTYGRLYVVWNDTGGGNMVIVSHCDTRPGGFSKPEHCDEADNWSVPAPVSERGSVIYADAAVGPDGKLYVTWWDFSARNAIVGRVCDPKKGDCGKASGFGELKEIAILNTSLTGAGDGAGGPLPFACPIPAQPGGRPGPSPGVEVDISEGPNRGRVYVSWGDIRDMSGVYRCGEAGAGGTPPSPLVLTWDSFVDSAPGGELPADAKPSRDAGTPLYVDPDVAEEGSEPEVDDQGNPAASGNSDEWFPWLVVDQQSGRVFADFYSTRDDTTRRTTHFYTREVFPDAAAPGGHRMGLLMRSSTQPSDYSTGTTACCVFGNDYGDYTGLDSAEGYVFPVWTRRAGAGDDGDAYTVVPEGANPQLVLHELKVGEGAASVANGNGQIEPGEGIRVFLTAKNPSEVGVTKVAGNFVSPTSKATVTQAPSGYPDIGPGGGLGTNVVAFEARLAREIPCGTGPTPVDFRVDLTTAQGPESVAFLVPVCAKATAPGPGGDQPGGDRPGGDRPGGDRPGVTPPGGDKPGTTCQRSGGLASVSASAQGRGVRLGFERRIQEPVTIDVFRVSQGRRVVKERLVARFANQTSDVTWNGRANRGGKRKKVGAGYYFVRYTMLRDGRRIDARRVVLRRSRGRFAKRPDFFRRDTCDLLGRFKLERPVFGGPRSVTLKGSYQLNEAARVTVTILRGSRVVRRYATAQREAGRTYRFTLPAAKRPRGEYRVRLEAAGAKASITTSLVSRRL